MSMGHQSTDGRVVAGLDLGGTKMLGILMDGRAGVLARVRRPAPHDDGAALSEAVLQVLSELLRMGREAGTPPAGIGIGAPGFIHPESGTILEATNLGVRDLPLGEIVAQAFALPTRVLHDVKAAALGEARFGAGAGAQHLAYLNAGTGISVGLILHGELHAGAAGRSGEIGHVCVQRDGPACSCGRCGCLEALAAGPALVRQARAAVANRPDSAILRLAGGVAEGITTQIIAEAARQGDALGLALIDTAADYLGLAIAGLIDVLDLERVIVGGGLSQMGELFLGPIRAAVARYVLPVYRDTVPILPPALGAEAGAVGAAGAVLPAAGS